MTGAEEGPGAAVLAAIRGRRVTRAMTSEPAVGA
ncbi:hypothetical protein SAMN04488085_103457 [Geodermatophilus ruber]|uniref:Uncharacterized protein n=1 Tax=Geodermatophilus ruber TaxID=504800 RepID=A0A1I4CGK3_9ACTN|nr:hypothetical protein SAMN04488085_103457 [Geodermatophilus ruber]